MKKRIISIICTLAMAISLVQPVHADEYTDFLCNEFKNTPLSEMKGLFDGYFDAFDVNTDAYNTTKGYTSAQKSMMILDAIQKDYDNFEELNQYVTEAAEEIIYKVENPNYLGLSKVNEVKLDFTPPATTDDADMFKIGNKEFIVLDLKEVEGEDMFFVMANDFYDYVAVDPANSGEWNDTASNLLPYKLTNLLAFGNYSAPNLGREANIPENVLRHIDVLHEWNIEPGMAEGYNTEQTMVAPISVISAGEFKEYGEKIGMEKTSGVFWTRTPVGNDVATRFAVNMASPKTFNKNKTWGSTVTYLRPVFYLKPSFFKEEKMQKCGVNVISYLEQIMSKSDIDNLYTESEQKEIFGALSVTPTGIFGDAIVGNTLTTDYTYSGEIELLNVEIFWEKSTDNVTWTSANGTNSKSYEIKNEDAGYYIRAGFRSTYDSVILRDGAVVYATKAEPVYTTQLIEETVADINTASDVVTLRSILQAHEALFHLDYSEAAFSNEAAEIFLKDVSDSVADVVKLYNQSIALDIFANASQADAKEKAESEYLLGSIEEYSTIEEPAQKDSIITKLYQLTTEKEKVSEFIAKAEEFIMLERFNNAQRSDAVELIKNYSAALGVDISELTDYQIEVAGAYVIGKNYGTDTAALAAALAEGVVEAKKVKTPSKPVEGTTEEYPSGGFIPAVTEKPEASGNLPTNAFSDLQSVSWGVTAINSLAEKGIITGGGDGKFYPNRLVTRNEFVKMMVSAFEIELTDGELSYDDIDNNSWSAKYIKAAVEAGIINGIDENNFGDGMNITRQDVAVIADRLMAYKGIELRSSSLNFADVDQIAEYALISVAKLNYAGIMKGLDGNVFAPNNGTTRAQAAVVIYNLLNYYKKQTETPSTDEGEEQVIVEAQVDKYDLLFQLGILSDEIVNDSIITRGELAKVLSVFGGYAGDSFNNRFSDVAVGHTYANEIEAVYENNIMAPVTEEMFMPDHPATYKEAYDALIAASGYLSYAGGTYEAEKAIANESVYEDYDAELTYDILKKLLFGALEIRVLRYVDSNVYMISDKNILNVKFDTYKSRGIVNAVSGISIGGRREYESGQIIITVDSTDYMYVSNDVDYSAYLGCEVHYYYREVDGSYEVIAMVPTKNTKAPLKLSFEQILSAERDLSAINYDLNNREKIAKISKNADFIFNGKRCYSITQEDLEPNNGYITLIESNGDNEYDVVNIVNYEYVMVAQVDLVGRTVLDRFTWQTFNLDYVDDVETVNITKNGRYIKLDYVLPGDVLSIARSRDGKIINVYVSDQKVTGNVKRRSEDECEIQIDNDTIKTVKDFDFAGLVNNITITVGIDFNGYAVGYYTETTNPDITIGYLYKVTIDEDTDLRVLHVLTQSNEYVKLLASEDIKKDGIKVQQTALDVLSPQLIGYTLGSTGDVKKMYTSETPRGIVNSQTEPLVLNKQYVGNAPAVIYNVFGMTLDFDFNFPKDAVMFDITMDNGQLLKDYSKVTNVGAQVISQSSSPEEFYVYNSDSASISRLCVYKHSPVAGNAGFSETFSSQAFLITQVLEGYDDAKDEAVTVYKGYHAGSLVQYKFSENLLKEIDPTKVKAGDVLLVWLSGSQINRFRRLFSFKEENVLSGDADLLCNYGDHLYDGSSITRGGTNWDYAYDWAQHIIERAEGRSGSTIASGTRWASLYGQIELVYKAETYSYPVVKFKVAGKTDSAAYTLDSSSKVYVYSIKNKTVNILDINNLNISNRKAVMTLRYGNIRDLIIYED